MPAATRLPTRGHDTRAIQGWLGHRSITSMAVTAPYRSGQFFNYDVEPIPQADKPDF
jgi:hypothetical protein